MARDNLIINLDGFVIGNLDDVTITSPVSGDILLYDEDLSGWVNDAGPHNNIDGGRANTLYFVQDVDGGDATSF
jgi:hypothetical protein